MKAYHFDPDLIGAELPAIHEWCHANGIDPKITPTNALVVIDELWITIDQYVPGPNGAPRIDPDRDEAMRTTEVVPLIEKPNLASLKPVDEPAGETSPREGRR